MAKVIMVQGTMSNAGKSMLVTGLCRVFARRGYRVAPFKSQNMALNSYITRDNLEMGRAQVVQAEACGIEPSVLMNPILLKPVTNMGSQVIVLGEVLGNYKAKDYYGIKKSLIPKVKEAFDQLCAENDIVVIEGAGSPAEINLAEDDIANMGMAKLANCPVLLVGDIDCGGVFAQLAGTIMLLPDDEKAMIKGLIINKFRGDIDILKPGLGMIEDITNKKCLGVLPYLHVDIDDEDSQTKRFDNTKADVIDICVLHIPRISNFTDFAALEATEGVSVRYVDDVKKFGSPDVVIIPGTKNTISDLLWLRQNGLEAETKKFASNGGLVIGICGGYQMLGKTITDKTGVEVEGGGSILSMGLLDFDTVFETEKHRTRVTGKVNDQEGCIFNGCEFEGYEIHMGRSDLNNGIQPMIKLDNSLEDGCFQGNVYGSYLHGFFDTVSVRNALFDYICSTKGISRDQISTFDYYTYKQSQYDILADAVEENLDMDEIMKILDAGVNY